MKTTNKAFKVLIQGHIIDSLCTDYFETVEEQLQDAITSFHKWYGENERKIQPNQYTAFKDWLLCLPTPLSVEYTYYGINQTLEKWFTHCTGTYKEMDSDKESNLYYHLVTREFYVLCKKHNISIY